MNLIKIFYTPEIFIDVIKNQALSSENEIYGWLIGYQKDNIPIVLAIIECKRFEQQTLISAIPDVQEFQEISSILPQGIGSIGIYHSHPFSSEIFHSHIDDTTFVSLSKQFPNCVSIVTNGTNINYYHMGKNNKSKEIIVKFIESETPKFLLISMEEIFDINIIKSDLNDKERIKIKILNELKDYFEKVWNDLEIFYKNSKISQFEPISKYFATKLTSESIRLKIPNKFKVGKKNQIIIDNKFDNQIKLESKNKRDYFSLKLNLEVLVPIYINNDNYTYEDINQKVKIELVNNKILQKVYYSILDCDNNKIVIPDAFYIRFFGFYIGILHYNKKKLNENGLSNKNFEFILKLISVLESFANLELSTKMKKQIQKSFNDIKIVFKNFELNKNKSIIFNN